MAKPTVQARLDPETAEILARLARRLGYTHSEVMREAIRILAAIYPVCGIPKIAGGGEFASDIPDLGSSKKHLQGFGR